MTVSFNPNLFKSGERVQSTSSENKSVNLDKNSSFDSNPATINSEFDSFRNGSYSEMESKRGDSNDLDATTFPNDREASVLKPPIDAESQSIAYIPDEIILPIPDSFPSKPEFIDPSTLDLSKDTDEKIYQVDLEAGTKTASGSRVTDISSDITNVRGTDGFESIQGDERNNRLIGNGGGDFIDGGAGDDYLKGSGTSKPDVSGFETGIFGGSRIMSAKSLQDAAYLNGGEGNDTIVGGANLTDLEGGSGNDTFVVDIGTAGYSTIVDFTQGEDVIQLPPTVSFENLKLEDEFGDPSRGPIGAKFTLGDKTVLLRGVDYRDLTASDFETRSFTPRHEFSKLRMPESLETSDTTEVEHPDMEEQKPSDTNEIRYLEYSDINWEKPTDTYIPEQGDFERWPGNGSDSAEFLIENTGSRNNYRYRFICRFVR